jgi:hypothetical protein
MNKQSTLWDFVEFRAAKEGGQPGPRDMNVRSRRAADSAPAAEDDQRADMDRVRRQTIKKLRASTGAWLVVMRVARSLPQPFTLNDLSVGCHRADPRAFGMKGYEQHPDNHRVHWILYGERGLIKKGLIQRVKTGLFRVPEEAFAGE